MNNKKETNVVSVDDVIETYKQRVMAVLADAPLNKLTNKEMLWAASNLPDNRVKGTNSTKMTFGVDHTINSIYQAFDISEQELKEFGKTMRASIDYIRNLPADEQTNSKSIEYIAERLGNNPKFVLSLIIKVMGDASDRIQSGGGGAIIRGGMVKGPEDIQDLLKKLFDDIKGKLGKEGDGNEDGEDGGGNNTKW